MPLRGFHSASDRLGKLMKIGASISPSIKDLFVPLSSGS